MFGLYRTVKYHRKIWKWLSETGTIKKHQWPGWNVSSDHKYYNKFLSVMDYAYCFLCDHVKQECDNCPLLWPYDECDDPRGLWTQWSGGLTTCEERKQLAYQIYNLPLKPYPLRKLAWWNNR